MLFTVLEFMFYDWNQFSSGSDIKEHQKGESPPTINNIYEVCLTILSKSEHSGETALARF